MKYVLMILFKILKLIVHSGSSKKTLYFVQYEFTFYSFNIQMLYTISNATKTGVH